MIFSSESAQSVYFLFGLNVCTLLIGLTGKNGVLNSPNTLYQQDMEMITTRHPYKKIDGVNG